MVNPLLSSNGQAGITQIATAQVREPSVSSQSNTASRRGDMLSLSEEGQQAARSAGQRVPLELVSQVNPATEASETSTERPSVTDQDVQQVAFTNQESAASAPSLDELTRSVTFSFDSSGDVVAEVREGVANETVVRQVPPSGAEVELTSTRPVGIKGADVEPVTNPAIHGSAQLPDQAISAAQGEPVDVGDIIDLTA